MSRDFDAELRALARLKADTDDSITRKLDTGVKVVRGIYAMFVLVIALAIYIVTIRYDVNQLAKDLELEKKARGDERQNMAENRKADRALLNQLYLKIYGVEITYGGF